MIGQIYVLESVLKQIASRVVNTLDIVACTIIPEYDSSVNELIVEKKLHKKETIVFACSEKFCKPLSSKLLHSEFQREPIFSSAHAHRCAQCQHLMRRNFQETFLLPIVSRKKSYGYLVIYKEQYTFYVEIEEELIKEFSCQIILAIESQCLYKRLINHSVQLDSNAKVAELYDSVNQLLFSVTIIADSLPHLWQQLTCERRLWLDQLRQATESALTAVGTLSQELNELESTPVRGWR